MSVAPAMPPAGRRVEIVASDERFAEIAGAWESLWRRVDGMIFQDWAWVDAWRRTDPRRAERKLVIGLLWNGDQLDAVLALAIVRRSGMRVLEWAAKEHSDFCDMLAASDCGADQLRLLWRETLAVRRLRHRLHQPAPARAGYRAAAEGA